MVIILRIRDLRNEFGLTQEELGKKIGQTKSNISKYETGSLEPGIDTLRELAKIFNVSLDYLMGASDIRNPYQSNIIKTNNKEEDLVPEEFTNADEARAYVNKHQIFGSGGFDADKLDDDEILEFANALLEQMKMVSYKYRK